MSKSFIIFALITWLVFTGCTSQAQFLASKQPTAIQAAVTRGQFEMNCPNATGQVLSQEVTQPAIQGPYLQGEERACLRSALPVATNGESIRSFVRSGETVARRSKVKRGEGRSQRTSGGDQ